MKIQKADLVHFRHYKPQTFTTEGGYRYTIDLAYLSKRIGLEYGFHYERRNGRHYKGVNGKTQLIRRDFYELFQICRDIAERPWEIYVIEDPMDLYRELDSSYKRFESVWWRFPPPVDRLERNPRIVPISKELWYWSYWEAWHFYHEEEYAKFTADQIRSLSTRNRAPVYLDFRCGVADEGGKRDYEQSRCRPAVYRKDLTHLLQLGVVKPDTTLSEDTLHKLREKHGIYELWPWMEDLT